MLKNPNYIRFNLDFRRGVIKWFCGLREKHCGWNDKEFALICNVVHTKNNFDFIIINLKC